MAGKVGGWVDGGVSGWRNGQMAFDIQTVCSPNNPSGDKSSHVIEFRINSSSLLWSSDSPKET